MSEPRDPVRPALHELLPQVAGARLTLVVAPAGSGKTTLLESWRSRLAATGADCAWLPLSPVHDDPALFLEDLFEAVPDGHQPAARLKREMPHVHREDGHAVARRVRRALGDRARPLHVFLDDLQWLTRDGPTDRLLDLLLRDGPEALRFVVASRGARPRATPRLLAAGRALEIGAEELSLRSDQVAAVLRAHGIEPSRVAPVLLAETRGWATGVQLAAGALAGMDPGEHDGFLRALGRQPDLFDYVAGELLVDEAAATRRLLELSAVVGPADEATLRIAAAESWSTEALSRALDRGLLRRDAGRLCMHPLWQDHLLAGLRNRSSAQAWSALHQGIATRLAGLDPERAVRIGIEGGAWPLISRLLDEHGRGWVDRGRYHFVEEALDRLVAAGHAPSPTQGLLRALTSARRDPEGAIAALEATADRLRSEGDREAEARALVDAGILAANENRPEDSLRLMRRLLSARRIATDPDIRALTVAGVAILLVSRNRHRVAARLLRRVRRDGLSILPRATIELGLCIIGHYTDADGTLRLLDEACADPAHRAHAPSYFLLRAHRARARGLRGIDVEASLFEAEEAAEAFRDFRLTLSECAALDALAKLLASVGRHEEAAERFERAASLAEQLGHSDQEATLRGQLSRELLAAGRREAALAQAQRGVRAFERKDKSRDPFTMGFTAAIAYRMLAECGEPADAYRRVQSQERRLRCPQLPIGVHQTQVFLARIAHLAGHPEQAREHLRQAASARAPRPERPHRPERPERPERTERHVGAELDAELASWAAQAQLEPAEEWDVRTLGGLDVFRGGRRIPEAAWRGRTTRRLLLRLLAAPHGERRERIETEFWPDADPARARSNLRVALSRLRRPIGEDALQAEGDRIVLAEALRQGWDVNRLDAALAGKGDAKAAAELMRGPFAPELFDDWAEDLRREIEARVVSQAHRRVHERLAQGDTEAAERLARALSTLAPLDEAAWAARAKVELARDDRGAAERTLERARGLLQRELGCAPGAELLAMERELANEGAR